MWFALLAFKKTYYTKIIGMSPYNAQEPYILKIEII